MIMCFVFNLLENYLSDHTARTMIYVLLADCSPLLEFCHITPNARAIMVPVWANTLILMASCDLAMFPLLKLSRP